MNDFQGWPDDTFLFFRELEANNNRNWYRANRSRRVAIEEASRSFLKYLDPDNRGEIKVFRLQRDARFSKGMPPYKLRHRAGVMHPNSIVHWIDIDPTGLSVSVGHPAWDRTQLTTFRTKTSRAGPAAELESILNRAKAHGWSPDLPELKRPLRDLPDEHPAPNLTRHKHLSVVRHIGTPSWTYSQKARSELIKLWGPAEPLVTWLRREIGTPTEPLF